MNIRDRIHELRQELNYLEDLPNHDAAWRPVMLSDFNETQRVAREQYQWTELIVEGALDRGFEYPIMIVLDEFLRDFPDYLSNPNIAITSMTHIDIRGRLLRRYDELINEFHPGELQHQLAAFQAAEGQLSRYIASHDTQVCRLYPHFLEYLRNSIRVLQNDYAQELQRDVDRLGRFIDSQPRLRAPHHPEVRMIREYLEEFYSSTPSQNLFNNLYHWIVTHSPATASQVIEESIAHIGEFIQYRGEDELIGTEGPIFEGFLRYLVHLQERRKGTMMGQVQRDITRWLDEFVEIVRKKGRCSEDNDITLGLWSYLSRDRMPIESDPEVVLYNMLDELGRRKMSGNYVQLPQHVRDLYDLLTHQSDQILNKQGVVNFLKDVDRIDELIKPPKPTSRYQILRGDTDE